MTILKTMIISLYHRKYMYRTIRVCYGGTTLRCPCLAFLLWFRVYLFLRRRRSATFAIDKPLQAVLLPSFVVHVQPVEVRVCSSACWRTARLPFVVAWERISVMNLVASCCISAARVRTIAHRSFARCITIGRPISFGISWGWNCRPTTPMQSHRLDDVECSKTSQFFFRCSGIPPVTVPHWHSCRTVEVRHLLDLLPRQSGLSAVK